MITTHTTDEMDVDIEVIKAQIQIVKTKKAERAGVKWHEEGEKNNVQDSQADGGVSQHYQRAE